MSKTSPFARFARYLNEGIPWGQPKDYAARLKARPDLYNGFEPPMPSRWHVRGAQGVGALCWGWMLYKFYGEGDIMAGLRYPWEHEGHGTSQWGFYRYPWQDGFKEPVEHH